MIRNPQDLFDIEACLRKADEALANAPESIVQAPAPLSEGGPHDFFSMGDYWWPNPATPDGTPYVRRDGESNPDAFVAHRLMLRRMRTRAARLAVGYVLSGRDEYADHAARLLRVFFLDPETRMNPHLCYAQAIPGICSGRGIGIIDTLHLIDVPMAVLALRDSPAFPEAVEQGLRAWFKAYLHWMRTHPYGEEERRQNNNHAVCWHVQAAAFARFVGDDATLAFCRDQYKTVLLPEQMAPDGSFPRELARTKPYAYSNFVLDNMITLCELLSEADNDVWSFALPDGRGIRRGMEFLYPYVADKSQWPYPPDVQDDDAWPVAMAGFLLAGLALNEPAYIALWQTLERDPANMEVRRNMAIREPLLWILGK
ncbi:MAG: alginate lyase family protein [Verrucomicrobiota bacterium]